MLLRTLTIKGFRCFEDLAAVPFHRLTVFIGQNDSGKTALLQSLEYLFNPQSPKAEDYRRLGEGEPPAPVIEIGGSFGIEPDDTTPADWRSGDGSMFELRKVFTKDQIRCEVKGNAYVDVRWNEFPKLIAEEQKQLLESIGIKAAANKTERQAQFQSAQAQIPKAPGWIMVDFGEVRDHLPRFEKVASAEYNHPDVIV
jgi:hypothetical protein